MVPSIEGDAVLPHVARLYRDAVTGLHGFYDVEVTVLKAVLPDSFGQEPGSLVLGVPIREKRSDEPVLCAG